MLSIVNNKGIKFNVIVVKSGENYGLNDALINDSEPLVEFYDSRFTKGFTPIGQFVSRYNLSTILEANENSGIDLLGYIPDWKISADNVKQVKEYIKNI